MAERVKVIVRVRPLLKF